MGKVKLQESNLDLANLCKPMAHLRTTIYKLWMFQVYVTLLEDIADDCIWRFKVQRGREVCLLHVTQ